MRRIPTSSRARADADQASAHANRRLARAVADRINRALLPWRAADLEPLAAAGGPGAGRRLRYLTAGANLARLFAAVERLAPFAAAADLRFAVFDRGTFGDLLAYLNRKAGGPEGLFARAGEAGAGARGTRPALLVDPLLLDYLERRPRVAASLRRRGTMLVALAGWSRGFACSAGRDLEGFGHALAALRASRLGGGTAGPEPFVRAELGERLARLGFDPEALIVAGVEDADGADLPVPDLLERVNSKPVTPAALLEALRGLGPEPTRLALLLIKNSHLIGHARIGRAIGRMHDALAALAEAEGIDRGDILLYLLPASRSSQLVAHLFVHLTGFPIERIVHDVGEIARAGGAGRARLVAMLDDISYSGRHLSRSVRRLAAEWEGRGGSGRGRVLFAAAPLFLTEHGRALHDERGVRTVAAEVLPAFRSSPDYARLDPRERHLYATFLEARTPPVLAAFEYNAPDNNRGKWFNRVVAPLFTLRRTAIR